MARRLLRLCADQEMERLQDYHEPEVLCDGGRQIMCAHHLLGAAHRHIRGYLRRGYQASRGNAGASTNLTATR